MDAEHNCVSPGSSLNTCFISAKPQPRSPPPANPGWERKHLRLLRSEGEALNHSSDRKQQRLSEALTLTIFPLKVSLPFLPNFAVFCNISPRGKEVGGGKKEKPSGNPWGFSSPQGVPTSPTSARLQLFCFLLNLMAHRGADTGRKEQLSSKFLSEELLSHPLASLHQLR